MPIGEIKDSQLLFEVLNAQSPERLVEFRQTMHYYYSRNTVAGMLGIGKNAKNLSRDYLYIICQLFNLKPSLFGYEDSELLPENLRRENERFFSFYSHQEGSERTLPFDANFFKLVNKHLLSVRDCLRICDYTQKRIGIHLYGHDVSNYHKQNTEYYSSLEEVIKTHKIMYKRIFQPPLDKTAITFQDSLIYVVENLFEEDFKHFCRCLSKFPDCCLFVVLQKPIRMSSYYLVDDRVALTEYYRFEEGTPVPDVLFIDTVDTVRPNSGGSAYFACFKNEFETTFQLNKKNFISVERLRAVLPARMQALRDKVVELRGEHKQLTTIGETNYQEYVKMFQGVPNKALANDYSVQLIGLENSITDIEELLENLQTKSKILAENISKSNLGNSF